MAGWMTPLRAVMIALAGGLMLGLAIGQAVSRSNLAPVSRTSLATPGSRAVVRTQRHARAAALALGTARIVDSIRRSAGLTPADPWTLVTGRDVPDPVVRGVATAAPAAWSGRRYADTTPRTVIALVSDTAAGGLEDLWINRGLRVTSALPRRDGEPCLTIVRVGRSLYDPESRPGNLALTLANHLPGLCSVATAFGRPGTHVAQWIARTNGRWALNLDWSEPTSLGATDRAALAGLLRDGSWFYSTSLHMIGCLRRDAEACQAWFDQPYMNFSSPTMLGRGEEDFLASAGGTTTSQVSLRRFGFGGSGWLGAVWLRDLIALRGAEAFTAFWTSDAPLDEAFHEAYGETIGEWMTAWLDALDAPAPRELRSSLAGAPTALLLMLVVVAAAAAYASRRTVSA